MREEKSFSQRAFSIYTDIRKLQDKAKTSYTLRIRRLRFGYTNLQKGIYETTEYLEAFLRNLLLNEKNELHNRNLHISGLLNEEKVDILYDKEVLASVQHLFISWEKNKSIFTEYFSPFRL